jgi:hypothetical protein
MVKPIRYLILPIIFISLISCGKGGHCDAPPTFEIGIRYVDNTGKSIFSNPINNPNSIIAFDLQYNFRRTNMSFYNSTNTTFYFTADTFVNKYAKIAIQFKNQGKYDTLIFHDRGTENEVCSNIDSVWYNNVLCTTNNNGVISIIK